MIVYEHPETLATLYTYGRFGSRDVSRSTSFSFVPMAIVEGDSIRVCYGVVQVGVYHQSTNEKVSIRVAWRRRELRSLTRVRYVVAYP